MSSTEVMAVILAVLVAVKLLVVIIKPKLWLDYVAKKFWGNVNVAVIILVFSAAVTLYFLLRELSIIQIFAAMLFASLLMGIGFARYSKDLLSIAEKRYIKEKRVWKDNWLSIIIWIILVLWVFYSVLY